MVQNKLNLKCGEQFTHGFFTSFIPETPKSQSVIDKIRESFSLVLTTFDGREIFLSYGQGLTEGYRPDSTLVVVFSLGNPKELGVGEHRYQVMAKDSNDNTILNEEGILVVTGDGSLKSNSIPQWFDALHPSKMPHVSESGKPSTIDAPPELPTPEVPEKVQQERISICLVCPLYEKDQGLCTECGCYMPQKTGLVSAECPIHKWGVYVEG